MFRCYCLHPQEELLITCSKLSAFYKVVKLVGLQNIKYILCKVYIVIYNY